MTRPATPQVKRKQWRAVDWTKQDVVIARELNVSRERVRQVRNILDKPKSPNHYKRTTPRFTDREIELIGLASDAKIAKYLGCSVLTVWKYRKQLGRKSVAEAKREAKWNQEVIGLMGKESDYFIAKKFGITAMDVNRKRRSLGIPSRTEREGNYHYWRKAGGG